MIKQDVGVLKSIKNMKADSDCHSTSRRTKLRINDRKNIMVVKIQEVRGGATQLVFKSGS